MIQPHEGGAADGVVYQDLISGRRRKFTYGTRVAVEIATVQPDLIIAGDSKGAGYLLDPDGHSVAPVKVGDRVVIEFRQAGSMGEWIIVSMAGK